MAHELLQALCDCACAGGGGESEGAVTAAASTCGACDTCGGHDRRSRACGAAEVCQGSGRSEQPLVTCCASAACDDAPGSCAQSGQSCAAASTAPKTQPANVPRQAAPAACTTCAQEGPQHDVRQCSASKAQGLAADAHAQCVQCQRIIASLQVRAQAPDVRLHCGRVCSALQGAARSVAHCTQVAKHCQQRPTSQPFSPDVGCKLGDCCNWVCCTRIHPIHFILQCAHHNGAHCVGTPVQHTHICAARYSCPDPRSFCKWKAELHYIALNFGA